MSDLDHVTPQEGGPGSDNLSLRVLLGVAHHEKLCAPIADDQRERRLVSVPRAPGREYVDTQTGPEIERVACCRDVDIPRVERTGCDEAVHIYSPKKRPEPTGMIRMVVCNHDMFHAINPHPGQVPGDCRSIGGSGIHHGRPTTRQMQHGSVSLAHVQEDDTKQIISCRKKHCYNYCGNHRVSPTKGSNKGAGGKGGKTDFRQTSRWDYHLHPPEGVRTPGREIHQEARCRPGSNGNRRCTRQETQETRYHYDTGEWNPGQIRCYSRQGYRTEMEGNERSGCKRGCRGGGNTRSQPAPVPTNHGKTKDGSVRELESRLIKGGRADRQLQQHRYRHDVAQPAARPLGGTSRQEKGPHEGGPHHGWAWPSDRNQTEEKNRDGQRNDNRPRCRSQGQTRQKGRDGKKHDARNDAHVQSRNGEKMGESRPAEIRPDPIRYRGCITGEKGQHQRPHGRRISFCHPATEHTAQGRQRVEHGGRAAEHMCTLPRGGLEHGGIPRPPLLAGPIRFPGIAESCGSPQRAGNRDQGSTGRRRLGSVDDHTKPNHIRGRATGSPTHSNLGPAGEYLPGGRHVSTTPNGFLRKSGQDRRGPGLEGQLAGGGRKDEGGERPSEWPEPDEPGLSPADNEGQYERAHERGGVCGNATISCGNPEGKGQGDEWNRPDEHGNWRPPGGSASRRSAPGVDRKHRGGVSLDHTRTSKRRRSIATIDRVIG